MRPVLPRRFGISYDLSRIPDRTDDTFANIDMTNSVVEEPSSGKAFLERSRRAEGASIAVTSHQSDGSIIDEHNSHEYGSNERLADERILDRHSSSENSHDVKPHNSRPRIPAAFHERPESSTLANTDPTNETLGTNLVKPKFSPKLPGPIIPSELAPSFTRAEESVPRETEQKHHPTTVKQDAEIAKGDLPPPKIEASADVDALIQNANSIISNFDACLTRRTKTSEKIVAAIKTLVDENNTLKYERDKAIRERDDAMRHAAEAVESRNQAMTLKDNAILSYEDIERRSIQLAEKLEAAIADKHEAVRARQEAIRKMEDAVQREAMIGAEAMTLFDNHQRLVDAFNLMLKTIDGGVGAHLSDDQKIEVASLMAISKRRYGIDGGMDLAREFGGASNPPLKSTPTPARETSHAFNSSATPYPTAPIAAPVGPTRRVERENETGASRNATSARNPFGENNAFGENHARAKAEPPSRLFPEGASTERWNKPDSDFTKNNSKSDNIEEDMSDILADLARSARGFSSLAAGIANAAE